MYVGLAGCVTTASDGRAWAGTVVVLGSASFLASGSGSSYSSAAWVGSSDGVRAWAGTVVVLGSSSFLASGSGSSYSSAAWVGSSLLISAVGEYT